MTPPDHVRIDLILDQPLLNEVKQLAKQAGLTGYTLLPALGGEGLGGAWSEDLVTGAQTKLVFMAVTSESKADSFMEALKPLLETYGLVVLSAPVSVVRSSKFD
jgi:hypothetical protein